MKRGEVSGSLEVREGDPADPASPHYVRLKVDRAGGEHGFGLMNEGFSGMGVRRGESYRLNLHARSPGPAPERLRVELVSADGPVLCAVRFTKFSFEWRLYSATLRVSTTDFELWDGLSVQLRGAGAARPTGPVHPERAGSD